ncbi:MAG: S41 family peptidase [Candidatus Cryptobacteroides sp.]
MKKLYPWVIAVLGIAVGVLGTLTFNTFTQKRNGLKVQSGNWSKLNLVMDQISRNYVDTIDTESVSEAAIVAALAKLDPHSVYMPPVELKDAETELAGNFDGIGIQFNVPNDTAIVLEVIPGGPSEKAGLRKGDRILKVDDKVIAGVKFPQDSMVRRMKGPAGTKVNITVGRGKEEILFEISRGKIPVHCVDACFMVNDTTGYIRLSKFSRNTYPECLDAGMKLLAEGMTHLVFDLRDNTGGYLDEALLLSNMFLDKGKEIVYMQGLHRDRKGFTADGSGILKDVKLTVVINESSASSSEIFAGAIQDNDRGTIVGRRSFGKGLVQEPVYFSDGSGIRLTVARFYTPSGRCIQKPINDDYGMDIYKRFSDGEMYEADSIKVDSTLAFKTLSGRTVFGGGGIIPDVFVPIDTTRVTSFYVSIGKKATQMRYASAIFDKYGDTLAQIDDYAKLESFLDKLNIPSDFREYAAKTDGITVSQKEWDETEKYLLPQIRGLIGRYSRLGENAYYKMYIGVDNTLRKAIGLD